MDADNHANPRAYQTPEHANRTCSQGLPPTPSSWHQQQMLLQHQIQRQQLQQQQLQQQQLQRQQQQLLLQLQQFQFIPAQQGAVPIFAQEQPSRPAQSRFERAIENESAVINVTALHREAEATTGYLLYPMKRQKRKDVWHFARLVRKEEHWEIDRKDLTNEHANLAYCLLCNTTLKFRVGKSKVPEHVEASHPAELAAFVAQTAQRERGDGEPIIRNLDSAFAEVDRGGVTATFSRQETGLIATFSCKSNPFAKETILNYQATWHSSQTQVVNL